MNSEKAHHTLPPVIRIFISSTFSDMEQERNYFNEHIAPKIKHICEDRGISFFSVDLRWGITEEDQINGQVLPICLSEIDRCRPFFIGILGNRYGSVMESIPQQIGSTLPWLAGKEGKSITEIEMLYAVLDHENINPCKNCAFYLRSDELSEKLYGQAEADPRLSVLKDTITSNASVPNTPYNSLEEFGRAVYSDILSWLDAEFPAPAEVSESRRLWYNSELLRNYTPDRSCYNFLNNYFNETSRSLLLYGEGSRGKTTFLTDFSPENGRKILINCGSDDTFLYWPSIAKEITNQLNEIDSSFGVPGSESKNALINQLNFLINKTAGKQQSSTSKLSSDFYLLTDEEKENFRVSFLQWITSITPKEKIYIFINDLNLLDDENTRLLSWLPLRAKNIWFVCSTNNSDMVENASTLGWNCKEMPLFPKVLAQEFLTKHLNIYGKKLSDSQTSRLLQSEITDYPGNLKSVANFLIQCGRFHNLDTFINDISEKKNPVEIFSYIYDYCISELSEKETLALRNVLGMVSFAYLSLNEQECYNLAAETAGIGAIEWSHLHNAFEQFGIIRGDYWIMRDEEIQKFVKTLLTPEESSFIHTYLGEYMLTRLHSPADESKSKLQTTREKTTFAKAALSHFRHARNWDRLTQVLLDYEVLFYLSKLDWIVVLVCWVTIFLKSEINIPDTIISFLKSYPKDTADNRNIALKVASILKDMSFTSYLFQVKMLLGITSIPSSLTTIPKRFSSEFIPVHNNMCELKNHAKHRELYRFVLNWLQSPPKHTPEDLSQVLFFKTDCESLLGMDKECLESANSYYQSALSCASPFDILRALSMRGNALYRLGKYSEAEKVQNNASKLALEQGELRIYLSTLNILAIIKNRNNEFEKAMEILDKLSYYWTKLDDALEIAQIHLNKCNALFLNGNTEAALKEARQLYDSIPADSSPLLNNLRISVLSNIGLYLYKLNDSTAEETLIEALSQAEAAGVESTAIHAMENLIRLYKESDRAIEMSETSDKLMELLWSRQDYYPIPGILKSAIEILLTYRYNVLSDKLRNKWIERFATIEGGSSFLLDSLSSTTSDSKKMEELTEKLALARSDNKLQEAADILYEMALVTGKSDIPQCIGYFTEAATLYKQTEDNTNRDNCLCEAVTLLIKKGVIQNQALFDKVFAEITNTDIRQVINLWTNFHSHNESCSDNVFNKQKGDCDKESCLKKLIRIASYDCKCEFIVLHCLVDLAYIIIDICSDEETVQLIRMLSEDSQETLAYVIVNLMTINTPEDIEYLKNDYVSPKAEKLLAFYEKCISICLEFDTGDVAALAGNIALMFRRRKDKEKTLKYHALSSDLYRKQGKIKDALIEVMNLATAHNELGDPDEAINFLYKGLEEATAAGETIMQGVIAGNIAAYLIRRKNKALNEEIIRCFSIEENSLRKGNAFRELVISLVNQAIFYKENAEEYGDMWKQKADEAEKYIDKYDLKEFRPVLKRIRIEANHSNPAGRPAKNSEQIKEMVNSLLSKDDIYCAKSISETDTGLYHVKCVPSKDNKSIASILDFVFSPSEPHLFRVICACRASMYHNEASAFIKKYISWWNEKRIYGLSLQQDDITMQCGYDFQAKDWESSCEMFNRFVELWQGDMACYGLICMGLNDLDIVCETKEKMLSDSDF